MKHQLVEVVHEGKIPSQFGQQNEADCRQQEDQGEQAQTPNF